ncbi:MAG TPA: hypothetical protein PKY30_12475 [Myxococcota bacterium]|nr:hypothetical protein [Myxococcota bacterium]
MEPMHLPVLIGGFLLLAGFLAGVWWHRRANRPVEPPGAADIRALGSAIYDSICTRDFGAYRKLFVNNYKIETESFRKGMDRIVGRVPKDARYDGLLVEQSGRAFLRVTLPTGSMLEIQVGKVVRVSGRYLLDDPVKGGRKHRDLDTVDVPTARPVVLSMDNFSSPGEKPPKPKS